MFDVNSFLQTTVTEQGSTEYVLVPEGDDFTAVVENVEGRTFQSNGQDRAVLDVTWNVNDPRAIEATGRDKNTAHQTIWLDMTPAGNLDMGKGKNVQLNRTREIFGQNRPGQPWNPLMFIGQTGRVQTKHRQTDRGTFVDVVAVRGL